MVGDTDTDILAARGAGVPSILVLFGYDPGPDARSGASLSIDRFSDLTPQLVDSLFEPATEQAQSV